MKLERVEIENYRAIEKLKLPLDPSLTVLHGANGDGKTSVLSAIAKGLSGIARWLPGVSGVGFRDTDLRGSRPLRVVLKADDGTEWERRKLGPRRTVAARRLKDAIEAIVAADRDGGAPLDLPIVAFYDTGRAVTDLPPLRRSMKEFPRYAALEGALSARSRFSGFFEWFYAMDYEELFGKRERRDLDYETGDMKAVRKAISSVVEGVSRPRVETRPLRFVVTMEENGYEAEKLALDQLSGGYRIMLALAGDLARRMAQGNPHLDDPLRSEAVVLIDEVDLHLHPSWQQRVLPDLTRTFPNAQFVVSTHSPQVLTTVRPERIVRLFRHDGRIRAGREVGPTYGAEAGGVLEAVMEVRERPGAEHNPFVRKLEEYMRLVDDGRGRCEEAISLRSELEKMSPRDPEFDRADMEMERREIFAELGKES